MTTRDEFARIEQNADAFMMGLYDAELGEYIAPGAYDPETVVTMRGMTDSLHNIRMFESTVRGGEHRLLKDDQLKRAGVWAEALARAGALREEHEGLRPYAGDYFEEE